MHECMHHDCKCLVAGTYSTHVWRLRDDATRGLVAEHVGGDTTLLIEEKGVTALPGIRPDVVPTANAPKEWGAYRTRVVTPTGICITVCTLRNTSDVSKAVYIYLMHHLIYDCMPGVQHQVLKG